MEPRELPRMASRWPSRSSTGTCFASTSSAVGTAHLTKAPLEEAAARSAQGMETRRRSGG